MVTQQTYFLSSHSRRSGFVNDSMQPSTNEFSKKLGRVLAILAILLVGMTALFVSKHSFNGVFLFGVLALLTGLLSAITYCSDDPPHTQSYDR